jgi:hypothetical protein
MKKYRVPKYAITEKGLKRLLKRAAKEHESVGAWATEHDITRQAVSAFLRKVQGPGLQIPEALGYRPQVVYIPIDEDTISSANPPRRPTDNPTSKVDHSKPPVEKQELRRQMKSRKKAKR